MKKALFIFIACGVLSDMAQEVAYKNNVMLLAGVNIPLDDYQKVNNGAGLPGIGLTVSYSQSVKTGISPVVNFCYSNNPIDKDRLWGGYEIVSLGNWKLYSLLVGGQLSVATGKIIIDIKGLAGASIITSPKIVYDFFGKNYTDDATTGISLGLLTGLTIRSNLKRVTYGIGADIFYARMPSNKAFSSSRGYNFEFSQYILQLTPYALLGIKF